MSIQAMKWARAQQVGNSTAKSVLMELAYCHNGKTGLCCPSLAKLCEVLEIKHKGTIIKAIAFLEMNHFITKKIFCFDSGKTSHTEYYFQGFKNCTPTNDEGGCENQTPKDDGEGSNNCTPQGSKNCTPTEEKEGSKNCNGRGLKIAPKNEYIKGNKREVDTYIPNSARVNEKILERKNGLSQWIQVEKPEEISPELWTRFTQVRVEKRKVLTADNWKTFLAEVVKTGKPLSEILALCANRHWAGFEAAWIQEKKTASIARAPGSRKPLAYTQTEEYSRSFQAYCRGERPEEKVAEDGVTILIDDSTPRGKNGKGENENANND